MILEILMIVLILIMVYIYGLSKEHDGFEEGRVNGAVTILKELRSAQIIDINEAGEVRIHEIELARCLVKLEQENVIKILVDLPPEV